MKNIILSIEGMTCSACSNGLEKYLNKQNGIINANVNLVMANASIDYNEHILNQEKIEKYVKQAGFKSGGIFKEVKIEKENKTEKIKFIVYSILAIVLMYISMGHMINLPTIPFLDPHTNSTNYMISLLILTICFMWYGFDILKNGYKNDKGHTEKQKYLIWCVLVLYVGKILCMVKIKVVFYNLKMSQ